MKPSPELIAASIQASKDRAKYLQNGGRRNHSSKEVGPPKSIG